MDKFDKGKPAIDLVPSVLIEEVANVLEFGSIKYSAHQWREGTDWSRFYSAAMRHLIAWNEGETYDPESGLNHLAHAACSMAFLLEYDRDSIGNDNRFIRAPTRESLSLDALAPRAPDLSTVELSEEVKEEIREIMNKDKSHSSILENSTGPIIIREEDGFVGGP